MIEARIDHSDLTRLVQKLEKSPQVLKEAKRQAFQAAAPKLKAAVDAQIGGSGRVRDWQKPRVGSEGGYAAVSPEADRFDMTKGKQKGFRAGPKEYAVGYVTNAINSGHLWPRNKLGYRRSAQKVRGREFYQKAQAQTDQIAQEAVQQVVQTLTNHLEGG